MGTKQEYREKNVRCVLQMENTVTFDRRISISLYNAVCAVVHGEPEEESAHSSLEVYPIQTF